MSIFVEKLSNFISFSENFYFKVISDPELHGSGSWLRFRIRPYPNPQHCPQHCCNQSNLASSVKHIFARVLPPVQGVKGKLLEPLQGEQGGQLLQQPPLQKPPLLPVELLLYQDLAGLCRVQVPVILIQDRTFDTRFKDRTIDLLNVSIHRYQQTDKGAFVSVR